MRKFFYIFVAVVVAACSGNTGGNFMPAFTEDFTAPETQNFNLMRSPLRYISGVHSLTEENTDVMLLAITPGTSIWARGQAIPMMPKSSRG